MADINQQTEELARKFEQLTQAMVQYEQLTKSAADQKRDADVQAATGLRNFTKGAEASADAIGELAGAAMSAGKSMLEGKKGASAFNESIDGMAKAAQAAGVALALLIPGGPAIKLLIAGITALTGAVAGLVKASNEMADKLYKSYSGLAKSGGAASDGMTGVYNDAKKLGLSMNELDSMVTLVGESSKDLALFSGSVFEGRKKFADVGQAMEPFRESLIKAGMTQEQINDGTMAYIRLQTRVGQAQNKTTAELAEGAKKYLVEQDALTKLTGATRKENEAALEEARSQQRFRAKLEAMRATGDEGQIAAAAELEKTYVLLRSQSKEAAQGFGDLTTGMMNTEAAQKTMMSTNGEAMQVANRMVAGQMKAIEGTQQIASAAGKVTKDFNMMYQMGVGEDFLLKIDEGANLGLLAQKDLAKQYDTIREDQKKQGQEGGKAADGITDQYAANIKQQQELNKKMEDVVFKGIDNALVITNKLGNATDTLATGFEILGKAVNKLLNIFGLGTKEPKVPAAPTKEQEAASAAVTTARSKSEEADKKLADQMAATESLKKSLETISKSNDKSAETTAKIAELKKQIAESESKELTLNKEAKLASAKKLEASAAQANANRAARGQASTSTATPTTPAAAGGAGAAPAAGGAAPAAKGGAAPAAGGAAPTTAAPAKPSPQPLEGEAGKESKAKLDDILKFTNNTGSKEAFEALDDSVKKAVIAAAEQYKAATGKPIQINSAKRDPEAQERLYNETVAAGRPGIGPTGDKVAKPGRSLHEKGHAVDIQNYNDPAAVAAMNAQGLFQKVPNDKVHFQAKDGGVFDGPDSGYNNITMHGTEAIIPLKNGAVPVRLAGELSVPQMDLPPEIKKFFQSQPQLDALKLLGKNEQPKAAPVGPDMGMAASQASMFAKLGSINQDLMAQGFDRALLEGYGEPPATQTQTEEAGTSKIASEGSSIAETVKEAMKETKEANFAILAMLSDLVREQRNANDISTRLLQVSSS